MTITIIDEPDIRVTSGELSRYRYEYDQAMRYHCGPRPTLEDWIRGQQAARARWFAAGMAHTMTEERTALDRLADRIDDTLRKGIRHFVLAGVEMDWVVDALREESHAQKNRAHGE